MSLSFQFLSLTDPTSPHGEWTSLDFQMASPCSSGQPRGFQDLTHNLNLETVETSLHGPVWLALDTGVATVWLPCIERGGGHVGARPWCDRGWWYLRKLAVVGESGALPRAYWGLRGTSGAEQIQQHLNRAQCFMWNRFGKCQLLYKYYFNYFYCLPLLLTIIVLNSFNRGPTILSNTSAYHLIEYG